MRPQAAELGRAALERQNRAHGGLAAVVAGQQIEADALPLVLAHLDHEPYALRVTDKAVSDRRLGRVVPENVAAMSHDAGLITYAQTCVINGKKVPHLVIQGKNGPVTVLLMPDEKIESAVELEGESISGVILPVGNGSIAIIGEAGESLDTIQKSVMQSVTWST